MDDVKQELQRLSMLLEQNASDKDDELSHRTRTLIDVHEDIAVVRGRQQEFQDRLDDLSKAIKFLFVLSVVVLLLLAVHFAKGL